MTNNNILTNAGENCDKLNMKIKYIKTGAYLPWQHKDGYYIYFRTSTKGVIHVKVSKEVYEGMRQLEGKISYSERKFGNNVTLFTDYNGGLEAAYERHSGISCSPGRNDGFNDMMSIIREMKERDRQIAKMRLEGFSIKEIAEELGVSRGTVNNRLKVIKETLSISA